MSMDNTLHLPHLRKLLGLRVRYQGQTSRIVEVLDEPPGLVLQPDGPTPLMPDHLGRSYDYAMAGFIVPVLSDDGTGLNNALLDLELLD